MSRAFDNSFQNNSPPETTNIREEKPPGKPERLAKPAKYVVFEKRENFGCNGHTKTAGFQDRFEAPPSPFRQPLAQLDQTYTVYGPFSHRHPKGD